MHTRPGTHSSIHAAAHASGADLAVAVAVGIETVVSGINRDISSGNIDNQCFNAFVTRIDQHCSVLEIYGGIGVNAVISCGDGNIAACQGDISGRMDAVIHGSYIYSAGLYVQISVFLFVGSDKAVISCFDSDGRFFDAETVLCMNSVRRRVYGDRSAGDDKVIIGSYAMSVCRVYCETSAAVDRQIIVRENSSVCTVLQSLFRVRRAAGQGIQAAFRECQEDLISLFHPDASIVAAIDFHIIQPNEDFGGIIGIHREVTVCKGS